MTGHEQLDFAAWLVFAVVLVLSAAFVGVFLWAVVELVGWVTTK